MDKIHSNQATPKYLGYVYQVLIAIEQCLAAPRNTTIWLECYGDVTDGTTSTEVKHHFGKSSLANNSIDFWKTLKNLVTEDISDFRNLVLHTTENISDTSIFHNWNNLTKTKKYSALKKHTPCNTVKPFYDEAILKYKRKDLLPILDKLVIKHSQLSVREKWEELSNHRTLDHIDEKYREDAIHWIYGYVNKKAINNRYCWHVKVNDFIEDKKRALSKYMTGKIPFPSVDKNDVEYKKMGLPFVNKMEEINLPNRPVERAVYDYLKSNNVMVKLLNYEPLSMHKNLEEFDANVLDDCFDIKESLAIDSSVNTCDPKKLFYDCLKLPAKNIRGVEDTQGYYTKGRIHHHINTSDFEWKFSEEDF